MVRQRKITFLKGALQKEPISHFSAGQSLVLSAPGAANLSLGWRHHSDAMERINSRCSPGPALFAVNCSETQERKRERRVSSKGSTPGCYCDLFCGFFISITDIKLFNNRYSITDINIKVIVISFSLFFTRVYFLCPFATQFLILYDFIFMYTLLFFPIYSCSQILQHLTCLCILL